MLRVDLTDSNCSIFQPPIVPKVSYDGDTRNFDDYPETNWQKAPAASEKDMRHFSDF